MGDLYGAGCPRCGYRAEGLQDGAGLIGTFLEPMLCRDCRELVSVVTADLYSSLGPELNACPRCGGRRLGALPKATLGEQAAAGGYRLRRWAECPRCVGRVAITPSGRWD
jgi:DNA-directed RNA polymerase subunit RPC12/RpoP